MMSNEKKVWVSYIDGVYVLKGYWIETSFPTLCNYLDKCELQKQIDSTKDTEKKEMLIKAKDEIMDRGIKIIQDFDDYKPVEELPESLWLHTKPLPSKRAYISSIANGFLILNQACADILKAFNLGATTLTPLKIHHPKTQEVLSDETYYFLNVAERREFVKKEQSNETLKCDELFEEWSYIADHTQIQVYKKEKKDYLIDIDAAAIDCELDLWGDSHLRDRSYFMSERLRNALKDAKLDKLWNIQPCNLV